MFLFKTFKNKGFKINIYTKIIFCIVLLGFVLRLTGGVDSILFTYDQARDAIYAMGFFNGQFKIVGPPSDVAGLFHGPLFYYLIAPAYFLAGGYPDLVFSELIFINLLSVIPLFILVKKLFNSDQAAVIAVLLFSVSFEVVSYSRWISNPSLALFAFAILYLGLWMAIKKEKYGFILLAIGSGIAIQSEVFLIYLIPFLIFYFLVYKINMDDKKVIFLSVFIFCLFLVSYITAEFKFHFQGLIGLKSFIFTSLKTNSFKHTNLNNYYSSLSSLFSANIFYDSKNISSISSIFILLFGIYTIIKNEYKKELIFIFLLFFSSLSVFVISTFNAQFVTVGATIPFLIIVSFAIWRLITKNKILGCAVILLIIIWNISAILKYNKGGNILFQIQDGMIFGDEINLVQNTYLISNNEKFSINTITNPLFNPTTWAYLYQIYSNRYHLNKPFYHGNSDPTSTGYNILSRSGEITKTEFTIIEPGLPEFWVKKSKELDDNRKLASYSKKFGLFTLITRND